MNFVDSQTGCGDSRPLSTNGEYLVGRASGSLPDGTPLSVVGFEILEQDGL